MILEQTEKKDAKQKDKRLIVVLLLVGLILVCLLHQCSNIQPPYNPIEQGIINLPNGYNAQGVVNGVTEQGMFQIFMDTAVRVSSDNEAALFIQNSESNHYSTYVTIHHGDDLIYKSGVIEPGFKIEKDRLNVEDFGPGEYDCKADFHILDRESLTEINSIGLAITVTKESASNDM